MPKQPATMEDVVLYGKKFTNQASVLQTQIDALSAQHELLHVRDEKASGTASGAFNSGVWRTRTLNTVKTNEIAGASLSSNRITLPAGTYMIEAFAPAWMVVVHKARLYDITAAADVIIGSSEASYNAAPYAMSTSRVFGRFTITETTELELQHYCSITKTIDGFGINTNSGSIEVYAEVMLWRVA